MTDDPDDLDTLIAALCLRRGRPRNGFQKAVKYADEVWALRRAGVRSWRSITQVAEKYAKTPSHIAACVKMINDTPPHEYGWDFDETDFDETEE